MDKDTQWRITIGGIMPDDSISVESWNVGEDLVKGLRLLLGDPHGEAFIPTKARHSLQHNVEREIIVFK